MSVTEEGGSNSKGGTRKSLRLGSKKVNYYYYIDNKTNQHFSVSCKTNI